MPSKARGAMVNLAKYSVCERVQRYESPGRGRTLPNLDVSVAPTPVLVPSFRICGARVES